ncbi:MAG TPA: NAD(P)/FAD-dependent oxidoreductase [Solirubrobacteraceae bacterium]|jgi:NADH dehydrogenase
MTSAQDSPRVVVVGGGFGGLEAVKALARGGAQVTLVDRHNYFLFQPLNYQVATGGLAPGDIAVPLRHIVRRWDNVEVLLGEVSELDLAARQIVVRRTAAGSGESISLDYDSLVVAGGSDYSYFGHEEWRQQALEVKSLDSALEVRGRILRAFEAAEERPQEQERWLTFVVVGAGPTGVEMAGQIAELARQTLKGEFRRVDPAKARVLLVEMGDRVLAGFPEDLSQRAERSLQRLGVSVLLRHRMVDVRADAVDFDVPDRDRETIATATVVWAAGVAGSPLARALAEQSGAGLDRSGRVTVEPDLSLSGHPEVLALGDMVTVRDPATGEARTFPGLAPVAMQQGRYVGRLLRARMADRPLPPPFRYRDKGSLATIGRAKAVGSVKGIEFSGFPAWAAWLTIHIFYLIGFENRAVVLLRWAYAYFTAGRGNRLITGAAGDPPAPD